MVTANNSTTRAATGIPGSAMTMTSAARSRSQTIITCRRGNLSPRPDRATPPAKAGTMLATKVTAASSDDRVRSYTSQVSATLASWSPATESICADHSARNSVTANTPPSVALVARSADPTSAISSSGSVAADDPP